MTDIQYKQCTKCKQEFPATSEFFARNKNTKSGFHCWCKLCVKQYAKEHPEVLRRSQENYNKNHPGIRAEQSKKYRKTHPQKVREGKRKWRRENPDKSKAQASRSYQRHKEKRIAYMREYRKTEQGLLVSRRAYQRHRVARLLQKKDYADRNRGKLRVHWQRMRALRLNAPGQYTEQDIKSLERLQGGRCYWCGCKLQTGHIDHVIPLAKGGSNYLYNLVLACPYCNCSKGSKLPWVWKPQTFILAMLSFVEPATITILIVIFGGWLS